MIELEVSEEQLSRAKTLSKELGKLKNSITKGDGNLAGFLGEVIVSDYFGWDIEHTYDYDLVSNNGKTVDVKTKRTTVKPKNYYECSIAAFNTKQECDAYVFVRVSNDMDRAWILGWKSKERYFKESRLLKKGDVDGDNGFRVKADCYNLRIDQLNTW